jgi:hypothetical protein
VERQAFWAMVKKYPEINSDKSNNLFMKIPFGNRYFTDMDWTSQGY